MFNNFVKSMMALCMVTSGWSSLDGVLKDGTSGNLEDLFEKANEEELLHKESDAIRNSTSSDLDSSNSSEGSIGPVDEATQTDEVGAVDSPDLNSSNSSDGSIEKVDAETQTIEEVKSPSTTSETMNKSINTVGTLEIDGHSSGEEGGSGSDNFQHNKDADTSTSSEEGTRTIVAQTENNVNSVVQFDGVDIVGDCESGEGRREALMREAIAPQVGDSKVCENGSWDAPSSIPSVSEGLGTNREEVKSPREDGAPDSAELQRIIEELDSLDDLESLEDKLRALYTEVNNYNDGWMSDYSRDLCKGRIVNIVKYLLNDAFDTLSQVNIADNLYALRSLSYSYYVWHKETVLSGCCAKLLQTINSRLNKDFSDVDLLKALNKRIDSLTGY